MADTTPASSDVKPLVAARPSAQVRADVSGLTHPGRVRVNNEDHFLVTKATRRLETIQTSLPAGDVPERADEINYVMVVADGMGGHAAGEVASRLTISALVGLALQIPDWIFWVDEEHVPEIERRTREAVQQVGSMLIERGREEDALRGHGVDADRRSKLWPRPSHRPRGRLAGVPVPCRPAGTSDQRSHLRATAP